MADSRRRPRSNSDDELDQPDRSVIPRISQPFEESDPEEEPEEEFEEEPEEDAGEPQPASPPAVAPPVASPPANNPPTPPPTFTTAFSVFPPTNPLHWSWMPSVLRQWRQAERMPEMPRVTEPLTPIPPLTLEPVHETIPVLITRLTTHDFLFKKQAEEIRRHITVPAQEIHNLKQETIEAKARADSLQEMVTDLQDQNDHLKDEVEALCILAQQAEDRAEAAANRVARLEERENARDQELATIMAERNQLREATAHANRMAERLEAICDRLS